MATVEQAKLRGERRIALSGISWDLYERLRENEANWHVQMTDDSGRLELTSPSRDHERIKTLIARLIEAFTEEMGIPVQSLGSTTWKRPELAKGLEADECYYILNHHRVCQFHEIDLAVNPPPDLAIETEISRGAPLKSRIYAALGVPEVWRWRKMADCLFARPEGDCRLAADETAWIRKFRAWVREHVLGEPHQG